MHQDPLRVLILAQVAGELTAEQSPVQGLIRTGE